jgi:hypothetical protein
VGQGSSDSQFVHPLYISVTAKSAVLVVGLSAVIYQHSPLYITTLANSGLLFVVGVPTCPKSQTCVSPMFSGLSSQQLFAFTLSYFIGT